MFRRSAIGMVLAAACFGGGLVLGAHWSVVTARWNGLFSHPSASSPPPKDIVTIEDRNEGGFEHFLGPDDGIHTKDPDKYGGYGRVRVQIVVSPEGKVVEATPVEGAKPFYADAVKLALRWRFVPFRRGGVAVYARLDQSVEILPLERRPDYRTPFPDAKDWNSVVITLSRSGCYGECPAYTVSIHGDGTVEYTGRSFVALAGKHTAKIPRQYVHHLVEAFRTADYFWLFDSYVAGITDNPTYVTSIAFDGRLKVVTDYVGPHEGMPAVVRNLEAEIDRVADTAQWLRGNGETAAGLVAEKFDFKADTCEAKSLLAGVVHYGGPRGVVRELIHAGAPVNDGCAPTLGIFAPFGPAAAEAAARGDYDLTLDIIVAGARKDQNVMNATLVAGAGAGSDRIIGDTIFFMPRKPDAATLHTALVAAAGACSSSAVAALLQNGAVAKGDRETVLAAAQGNLPAACAAVIGVLAKAGASVEGRDTLGDTPILRVCCSVEVAKVLIAAGADVNARDHLGQTALMQAIHRDVVLVLLQAGADPMLKDNEGRTALQRAEAEHYGDDGGRAALLRDWIAKHKPARRPLTGD